MAASRCLLLALRVGPPAAPAPRQQQDGAWLIGAARVVVLAGEVEVCGALLSTGATHDVASAPFDSALSFCARSGVPPQALAAGSSAAALDALQQSAPASTDALYALVAVLPVPHLTGCLKDYDVSAAAGLPIEGLSLQVPGACLLRHRPEEGPAPASPAGCLWAAVVPWTWAPSPAGLGRSSRAPASGRCRVSDRSVQVPPPWEAALDEAQKLVGRRGVSAAPGTPGAALVPRIVVAGPKGSGKSTFNRLLVNRLLRAKQGSTSSGGGAAAVAYLDMDLGQPEWTPPGCVSLTLVTGPVLSPPHARVHHSRWVAADPQQALQLLAAASGSAPSASLPLPVTALATLTTSTVLHLGGLCCACRYFGAASPKSDPDAYVRACKALVDTYSAHFEALGVPLVINTHGWVRGVGAATIQAVIDHACPALLVVLEGVEEGGEQQDGEALGTGAADSGVAPAAEDGATSPVPLEEDDEAATPQPAPKRPRLEVGAGGATKSPRPVRGNSGSTFRAPRVAWVPPALAGRVAPVFSQSFLLRPWHTGPTPLQAAAAASQPPPPPRAVRSPPDLRSLRFLVYFLAGVRVAAPPASVTALWWGGRRLPLQASAATPETVPMPATMEATDADEAIAVAAAAMEDEGDAEDAPALSSPLLLLEGDALGPLPSSQEDDSEGGGEEEEEEEEEAAGLEAEEGSAEAAARATLATGLPEELCPPAPLAALPSSDFSNDGIIDAWHRAAARGVASSFWRVLGDGREARAPSAGWASPAFAVAVSQALKVPAVDVDIALDACAPLARAGQVAPSALAEQRRRIAPALAGHVVALCSRGRAAASPSVQQYCDLPCIGLAFVREVVVRALPGTSVEEPLLCLITPVPPAIVARAVDTLVAWSGAADVPAQLLHRGSTLLRADAFTFAPGAQLGAASGTRTSGDARKNLGRKRLGGGAGRR